MFAENLDDFLDTATGFAQVVTIGGVNGSITLDAQGRVVAITPAT